MIQDLIKAYPIQTTLIILAAVTVLAWYVYQVYQRRWGNQTAVMSATELKKLEKKQLLTPDELKRVREAIAKQYIRDQEERARAQAIESKGMAPLEMLAVEAEKADELIAQKGVKLKTPQAAPPVKQDPRDGDVSSVPKAKEEKSSPSLPEHLAPYAKAHPHELEQYRNAGFLSEEDFDLLMKTQENRL